MDFDDFFSHAHSLFPGALSVLVWAWLQQCGLGIFYLPQTIECPRQAQTAMIEAESGLFIQFFFYKINIVRLLKAAGRPDLLSELDR